MPLTRYLILRSVVIYVRDDWSFLLPIIVQYYYNFKILKTRLLKIAKGTFHNPTTQFCLGHYKKRM